MRLITGSFLILISQILFAQLKGNLAQHKHDSLLQSWNNPNLPDTIRLESLDELIWSSFMQIKPDSAEYYSNIEYDFAIARNQKKYMAYAMNGLGVIYSDRGSFYKAIDYHKRSLQIKESMEDERGIAVSFNNIGQCYYNLGQFSKAADYYFKALKIREKIGDKKGMATSLGNIGAVYNMEGNIEQSMTYQKKSLRIYEELKNEPDVAHTLLNISFLYKNLGDTATAIDYQERAVAIYEKLGNLDGYARALHSLGNTYEDLGSLATADSCQQLGLKIKLQLGDNRGLMYAYYALSTIAYHRKNTRQAITYGEKALAIATTIHSLNMQHAIGDFLYRRYQEAGNYREALAILEKVRTAGDSLRAQGLREKLYEEQLKYDYEKKEIQTQLENERKQFLLSARLEEEKNRKNKWIVGLGGLFVLLVATSFLYIRFTRQKAIIAEQKNNLLKQKLLISQINPHFIFNSLNAIQNFIFNQDSLKSGTYLARFAGLMRMILNFSREDFISVASEQQFLTEYLELQQLRFREKFSYRIDIDESIDKDDTLIPPMLAQPFVENAIEHGISQSSGDGLIHIKISREKNRLCYEIDDNGIGLNAARPRENEHGKGHRSLATVITRERLEALGKPREKAEISITDKQTKEPGKTGVSVRFTIPFQHMYGS